MDFESLSKEQKIMVAMRKTLANIIKDTTPNPGETHALTEATVNDIKMCLGLIASRERELLEEKGVENQSRPRFVDEKQQSQAVNFQKPSNS